MTKVILMAMASLFAASPAAGKYYTMGTPEELCTALTEEFMPSGEWAPLQERLPARYLETPTDLLTPWPAFDSLVPRNHLDVAQSPAIEVERFVPPYELRAAVPGAAAVGDWHPDTWAALSSAPKELARAQRLQARAGRDRKLWPQRRPVRAARVCLARKQP